MWKLTILVFTFFHLAPTILAQDLQTDDETAREAKILPIFQVVRFPNDVCAGNSRNGTCYTAEECSSKGGVTEGTCASGFGVCCIISLSCGGTTSENTTYIIQGSTTSAPASPCVYKICPCNSDICRIRYDMTTMVLANPVVGTASESVTAAGAYHQKNYAYGDCATDTLTIASPGSIGSPVVCGVNTDQHMIIDSNGLDCQTVTVAIGGSSTTTRKWDITATQYTCGQEDMGGPPGCLQYYTGDTGLVKSFAYPTTNTAGAAQSISSTHLQNQNYQVCVRRSSSMCYICWSAWNTTPGSFGLSVSPDITDRADNGASCTADFITIPNGMSSTNAAATTPVGNTDAINRYCGRHLSTTDTDTTEKSVCSRVYPFRLGVNFNDYELCDTVITTTANCELDIVAINGGDNGGILGFAIGYTQVSC